MFDVKETRLLQHPTVEKAYNVMRTFFADDASGDAFAREAVRTGEMLTAYAEQPDPDAIAAVVLMDGMIVRYDAKQFAQSVSPQAAAYLEKFYALDIENPIYDTEAERQILLAHSIKGLEGLNRILANMDENGEYSDPDTGRYFMFREIKQVIDNNEKSLRVIMPETSETGMTSRALELFIAAQNMLETQVKTVQATLTFDTSGLPDHPTVRGVYDDMLANNLSHHPMGGYVRTNTAIARILVDTHATQDPDVIAAALLNQGVLRDEAGAYEARYGSRLMALYQATSPFARMGTREEQAEAAKDLPEAKWVSAAARTYFLEGNIETAQTLAEKVGVTYSKHQAIRALEQMEDMQTSVKTMAADTTLPTGLRDRMARAVNTAHGLLYAPENKKIRKPGSPKMDMDW